MSEQLLPEEIGRVAMVEKVAAAVKVAMERAGITDPADVHYVQTKTPLLTIHTIRDAKSRGKTVWTEHTHESMDLSNGSTALGIAVALGEIEMPTDADVMHDRSLYSAVASCSSRRRARPGPGRRGRQRPRRRRPLPDRALGDADALDADGIWAAIRDAGLDLPERPHRTDLDGRLVNVFLKCEVSQDGMVARPAQRDAGRLRRALAPADQGLRRRGDRGGDRRPGGVRLGLGRPPGPDGGGPVAAIVDLGDEPTGYLPPSG